MKVLLHVFPLLTAVLLTSNGAAQTSQAISDEWWVMNDDGCSLYVLEVGQGEPIVVVHGGFGAEHGYLRTAFEGLEADSTMPETWNFIDDLAALERPVTVIVGDDDFIDPGARMHRRYLEDAPNVDLVVVEQAGHSIWVDQPERFRVELERALEAKASP